MLVAVVYEAHQGEVAALETVPMEVCFLAVVAPLQVVLSRRFP